MLYYRTFLDSSAPYQGTWGIWQLPGSAEFHVMWSGAAEILGGAGMIASTVPAVAQALPWLGPASAQSLFWFTLAVTPSDIYMFTHNAPGPLPKVRVQRGNAWG